MQDKILSPLIVTGLHRSGTTWMGKIVDSTGLVNVVHEPLNLRYGMEHVPCWYPFHPGREVADDRAPFAEGVEELWGTFFRGEARYLRESQEGSVLRKAAKRAFGGASERQYRRALRQGKKVCIKDPFALFSVPFLVKEYNARVLVIIRHPGALLLSFRRMDWSPPLESLLIQPGILAEIESEDLIPFLNMNETGVLAHALFWTIGHRFIRGLLRSFPDRVAFVLHEDLAVGKPRVLHDALAHLGLVRGEAAAATFLNTTIRGSTIIPDGKVLHNFFRDGENLVKRWKTDLPAEDIKLIEVVAQKELEVFYNQRVMPVKSYKKRYLFYSRR